MRPIARFVVGCVLPLLLTAGAVRAEVATWVTLRPGDPTLCEPMYGHALVRDPVRDRLVAIGWVDMGGGAEVWTCPLSGPPAWGRLRPAGDVPGQLYGHTAIYDPVADRVIVFGSSDGTMAAETWALALSDPPVWTHLQPSGARPPGRSGHSAVYDAARHRMIVYGGGFYGLSDVWALSLSGSPAWSQLTPVGGLPLARTGHAAVVDAAGDRMIVFGGQHQDSNGVTVLNDVWALSLSAPETWTLITPAGTAPAPRLSAATAFDASRRALILFGGHRWYNSQPLADTWRLDLAGSPAWSALAPASPPPPTGLAAAVVDAPRDRFLVHGGLDDDLLTGYGTLHTLPLGSPDAWTKLAPGDAQPPPRLSAAAVVDSLRGQLIVVGGAGRGRRLLSDVWSCDLAGSAGWTDRTAATGAAALGVTWTLWDGAADRLLAVSEHPCDPMAYSRMDDVFSLHTAPVGPWATLAIAASEAPYGRYDTGLFLDPQRNRLLMVEGTGYSSRSPSYCYFDDVWSLPLDTLAWRNLVPWSHAYSPAGRGAAVFDSERDRVLVFPDDGGSVRAFPLASDGPWQTLGWSPGRAPGAPLFLDPARDRVLAWSAGDSLWSLRLHEGASWQALAIVGQPPRTSLKPVALDLARDRLLFFGGSLADNGLHALQFDQATPVLTAPSGIEWRDGRIEARWWMAQLAADPPLAQRRTDGGEWSAYGSVTADGAHDYVLVDADASPGHRYGYRLVSRLDGGVVAEEQSLSVPGDAGLELAGPFPNPSDRELAVEFTLPDRTSARLALYDLLGRRLVSSEVGELGGGRHRVRLATVGLAAGLYVVRLERAGVVKTTRALIVR